MTLFLFVCLSLVCAVLGDAALSEKVLALPLWSVLDGKGYATNISIGSSKEPATVLLNTWAPLLWISPSCAGSNSSNCHSTSLYDPARSSTAENRSLEFRWYSLYLDQSNGIGTNYDGRFDVGMYSDDVTFQKTTLKNMSFGVAQQPRNLSYGELGVGPFFPNLTTQAMNDSTFFGALVAQDNINSRAFGLQLPSAGKNGALNLGGIDTKRYKCGLMRRPLILDVFHQSLGYGIKLTGLGQKLPANKTATYNSTAFSNGGLEVTLVAELLDSRLPEELFIAIGKDYPEAKLHSAPHLYSAPCNTPEGSIELSFGNKTISIPYRDFVRNDGKGMCFLKIQPTTEEEGWALGEAFFRAAYTVFDVDNNEIWLGQADDCGSEIKTIGKGKDAVPIVEGCSCGTNGDKPAPSGSGKPAAPSPSSTQLPSPKGAAVKATPASLLVACVLAAMAVVLN